MIVESDDESEEGSECHQVAQGGSLAVPVVGQAGFAVTLPTSEARSSTYCDSVDLLDERGVDLYLGNLAKGEVFKDDLTGQPLNPELVRAARRKEMEYFNTKGVGHETQS